MALLPTNHTYPSVWSDLIWSSPSRVILPFPSLPFPSLPLGYLGRYLASAILSLLFYLHTILTPPSHSPSLLHDNQTTTFLHHNHHTAFYLPSLFHSSPTPIPIRQRKGISHLILNKHSAFYLFTFHIPANKTL